MLKNGTPASPATARANSVLPVPGGPYNNTPFGIRAPNAWNFFGFSKNSLISCSSSTASSTPATSRKVIFGGLTSARWAGERVILLRAEDAALERRTSTDQKTAKSASGARYTR
jgi:hypothetical protein